MTDFPQFTARNGESVITASSRGATLLTWEVGGRSLFDGLRGEAELASAAGARGSVMAPWSNRIRDGKYTWQGREYQLQPQPGASEVIHGLVFNQEWTQLHSGEHALRFQLDLEPTPGYPFPLRLQTSYEIRPTDGGGELEFTLSAQNTGEEVAPVGLGWHPYFRLGPIADMHLHTGASHQIMMDSALIPLDGEAAFAPMQPVINPLGDAVIDQAYTGLTLAQDGRTDLPAWIGVRGEGGRISLRANLNTSVDGVGVWHAFTGDTLNERRREALALEPCQFMTNAFNREECAKDLALEPGDSRVLRVLCTYTREED